MKDYFMTDKNLVPLQNLIYEIRGQKVMLDSDLARLYSVETFRLNESVKRNIRRFPSDFMFQLSDIEWENLKSQIAMSNNSLISQNAMSNKRGGRRTVPYVFTEQGVAMLSSVLNSQKAIDINIEIMRAFVKMRQYAIQAPISTNEIKELKQMLMLHIDNTDNRFGVHEDRINQIIRALNNLSQKPTPNRKIGFDVDRK